MLRWILPLLICIPAWALKTGPEYILTWSRPTQYVDGSPLPIEEIGGYKLIEIFNGVRTERILPASSLMYSGVRKIGDRYCWELAAFDIQGDTSAYSKQVCKTFFEGDVFTQPQFIRLEID